MTSFVRDAFTEISNEKRDCSFVTYCMCRSAACGTKVFVAGSLPLASYGEVIPCYSEGDGGPISVMKDSNSSRPETSEMTDEQRELSR